MRANEWERIDALFHAALDRPPTDRSAYVHAQSLGDESLRREVESLLASHEHAEGFLEGVADGSLEERLETDVNQGDVRPGGRLGAFEILDAIGAGGMGRVYRARDTRLDRFVAIKVLSSEIADDPRSRERFDREARVVSRLAHPHICTLYDLGLARLEGVETPFLVMELLDGETLAARLARGAMPIEQAVSIASQIAGALSAAHAIGIVHRDLKPANIMLTTSGVKLLDFGLARWRGPVVESGTTGADGRPDASSTEGLIIGTLPYMAPEQLRGEAVDGRTDLFAFGAVLYEMLTGARPFAVDSQAALVAAILEHEPAPLAARQPLTPPALSRLVTRCLAKNPSERWQNAQDVAFELTEIQERIVERPAATRRSDTSRRYVRGLLPAAIVAGLLGLLLWSSVPSGDNRAASGTARPVIVLMDSAGPRLRSSDRGGGRNECRRSKRCPRGSPGDPAQGDHQLDVASRGAGPAAESRPRHQPLVMSARRSQGRQRRPRRAPVRSRATAAHVVLRVSGHVQPANPVPHLFAQPFRDAGARERLGGQRGRALPASRGTASHDVDAWRTGGCDVSRTGNRADFS